MSSEKLPTPGSRRPYRGLSGRRTVFLLPFAAWWLGASAVQGAELLPVQPGQVVVTCRGSVDSPYVVAILDVRDPECDPLAVPGERWWPPADHGELPNPTDSAANEWTVENLGQVFGVAVDDAEPPNVYVTSTTSYRDEGPGSGAVFRLDGGTGEISLLASLPNASRAGLGNVGFDRVHQQLHVTNFEDGRIYRLGLDGTELQVFDPFGPDDGAVGHAALGERAWGVQCHEGRLYFGTWSEDSGRRTGVRNGVFSVAVDSGGAYLGVERLEFLLQPRGGRDYTNPIADLAFSRDGDLLLAERTMRADEDPDAHDSRVLEFLPDGAGGWAPSPRNFQVGDGIDAAGGVDYAECIESEGCPAAADHVLATGDRLIGNGGNSVHGLQVLPRTGGTPATSYLIPFPVGKRGVGDVEYLRHAACLKPLPCLAAARLMASGGCDGPARLDASASSVTNCEGEAEYRFLDPAGGLARDWSAAPDWPADVEGSWTVEVRCATEESCLGEAAVDVVLGLRPLPGPASASDHDFCTLGIALEWEPSDFGSSGGVYNVYRSLVSCADALASPPLVAGLLVLGWLDETTGAGLRYHYVIESEGAGPPGSCLPVGPSGGPVAQVCLDPVTDVVDPTIPAFACNVLRGSHVGHLVTFTWDGVRPLLPREHFHLKKAVDDPSLPFGVASVEGLRDTLHSELDASSPLQFFDLRIANDCVVELESDDEYPPGWDRPVPACR